jgi:phospholipid transport system substrate-binding protein
MVMAMQRFLFAVLAILICLQPVGLHAADTAADPAVRQIESFYVALLDTMKRGEQLGLQGRDLKLAPITEETFDLAAMAQLSVGPSWPSLSQSERQSIIEAFKRMTIVGYAKNFAKFAGEQFLVEPLVKTRNSDKIVESKLLGLDHSSVPFNYRMHLVGDKWKVVDVYLNGYVSQLALRRADFSSTIASSGAFGLVKKINEMVDKQMNGG